MGGRAWSDHSQPDGAAGSPIFTLGPLHLSDGQNGSVLVSEEFAGQLTKIARDGSKSVVYKNAAWDVAGTDRRGRTIYLTESQGAGPEVPRPLAGHIRSIDADGKQRTFGGLAALEMKHNADGGTPRSAPCRHRTKRRMDEW